MATKNKALTHLFKGSIFAGDFRIVEPLSAGGMGAVYIVEQLSTGKERALKLMHPELLADARLRERFVQEARVAALVESEHVVEVVSAGVDEASEMPWLAMELLRGESLADAMARKGRLSAAEARLVFRQLCHAMGAAHRAKIVHRDLKPENIFLARTRRADAGFTVKVLDFGIAKIMADAVTKGTAALGTPLWMAPEQTTNATINVRADVWSLGLIAFHVLTGRYYWSCTRDGSGSIHQLMREVLFEHLASASARLEALSNASPTQWTGVLPDGFDAWFAKCVVRDEKARFDDASTLHGALDPLLARAEAAAASMEAEVAGAPTERVPNNVSSLSKSVADPCAETDAATNAAAPLGSGTLVAGMHTLEAARRASDRPAPQAMSTTMSPVIHGGMTSSTSRSLSPSPNRRARRVGGFLLGAAVVMSATFGAVVAASRSHSTKTAEASASSAAMTTETVAPTTSMAMSEKDASSPSLTTGEEVVDAGAPLTDAGGLSRDAGGGAGLSSLSVGDLKKRGREALARRDYRGAQAAFETAINVSNQQDHEAICGLGDVYRAKHDLRMAEKFYMLSRYANRHYLPAVLGFADVAWELHDRKVAMGAYATIIDEFPRGSYPEYVKERARQSDVSLAPPSDASGDFASDVKNNK